LKIPKDIAKKYEIESNKVFESCGDCISRQAVIKQTYEWCKDEFLRDTDPFYYLRKKINSLPSVTSAEKVGHWITLKDEYGDVTEAVCSCCDKNGNHKWAFCPNCGAKMEKMQEMKE